MRSCRPTCPGLTTRPLAGATGRGQTAAVHVDPAWVVLPAPPPLDRALRCVWFARDDTGVAGTRQRVLPNGVVELIISLRDEPYGVLRDSMVHTQRTAWLCGIQRGPLVIQSPADGLLVGLRFRPGGMRALWRVPLHELTDDVVAFDGIDGPLLATLRDRLRAADTVADAMAALAGLLAPRVDLDTLATGTVHAALRALGRDRELGMGALAAGLGVTPQHLVRIFRDGVGVPPRLLTRILRFDRVVRAVGPLSEPPRWASIAADAGYYDQSHLVSEFRTLAGVTPTGYWARRLPGGEHLAEEPV